MCDIIFILIMHTGRFCILVRVIELIRVLIPCIAPAYPVQNMNHQNTYFMQWATPYHTMSFTYHIYYYSTICSININKRLKEVPCCLLSMIPITDQQTNSNVMVDSSWPQCVIYFWPVSVICEHHQHDQLTTVTTHGQTRQIHMTFYGNYLPSGNWNFFKNLEATSKFQVPEDWHVEVSYWRPTILGWPVDFTVIWCFLLSVCELIHISICKE
jgi:hypothetical protein